MVLAHKLNFNDKGELAASLPLWLADDVAAEFADQFATNVKSKSDSTRIYLLCFLEEPIHFEEFWHVLLNDADASVWNTDLQQVVAELKLAQFSGQ